MASLLSSSAPAQPSSSWFPPGTALSVSSMLWPTPCAWSTSTPLQFWIVLFMCVTDFYVVFFFVLFVLACFGSEHTLTTFPSCCRIQHIPGVEGWMHSWKLTIWTQTKVCGQQHFFFFYWWLLIFRHMTLMLFYFPPHQTDTIVGTHDAPIRCVEYCPEVNVMVTGSWDRSVRLWDPRTPCNAGTFTQPEKVKQQRIK